MANFLAESSVERFSQPFAQTTKDYYELTVFRSYTLKKTFYITYCSKTIFYYRFKAVLKKDVRSALQTVKTLYQKFKIIGNIMLTGLTFKF